MAAWEGRIDGFVEVSSGDRDERRAVLIHVFDELVGLGRREGAG